MSMSKCVLERVRFRHSWMRISSDRREVFLQIAFANGQGNAEGMLNVKCRLHVRQVAAIDCTDVEHAPIRVRIACVQVCMLRQIPVYRDEKRGIVWTV